jgi:hypothetical protein
LDIGCPAKSDAPTERRILTRRFGSDASCDQRATCPYNPGDDRSTSGSSVRADRQSEIDGCARDSAAGRCNDPGDYDCGAEHVVDDPTAGRFDHARYRAAASSEYQHDDGRRH